MQTKQATHTPGPWIYDGSRTLVTKPCLRHNGIIVCTFLEHHNSVKAFEREANARLLAAAPELLEALRTLEARITKAANAFYVSGKASALREALGGWREEIAPARELLAKLSG